MEDRLRRLMGIVHRKQPQPLASENGLSVWGPELTGQPNVFLIRDAGPEEADHSLQFFSSRLLATNAETLNNGEGPKDLDEIVLPFEDDVLYLDAAATRGLWALVEAVAPGCSSVLGLGELHARSQGIRLLEQSK